MYVTYTCKILLNMALQGLVHSSILDAKTFKNQIKEIKTQLPIGESITIDIENSSLSELFQLITSSLPDNPGLHLNLRSTD